jgi:hypothetical protein
MKTLRVIGLLIVCIWFIISISSCAVTVRGDNGHHGRKHHNETYVVYPGGPGGHYEHKNNPAHYNKSNNGHSGHKDKDKK